MACRAVFSALSVATVMFGSQPPVLAAPTTGARAAEPKDDAASLSDLGKARADPTTPAPKPTAEEDDAVPELRDPGRFRRLRRAFLISGLTSWGTAYGLGAVAAFSVRVNNPSAASAQATDWLFAPLVGPWMALARRQPCGNSGSDSSGSCDSGWLVASPAELLVIDGLLQGAGAALTTVALVLPRDRALAKTTPMIAPYARPDGAGVVMAGAF